MLEELTAVLPLGPFKVLTGNGFNWMSELDDCPKRPGFLPRNAEKNNDASLGATPENVKTQAL